MSELENNQFYIYNAAAINNIKCSYICFFIQSVITPTTNNCKFGGTNEFTLQPAVRNLQLVAKIR